MKLTKTLSSSSKSSPSINSTFCPVHTIIQRLNIELQMGGEKYFTIPEIKKMLELSANKYSNVQIIALMLSLENQNIVIRPTKSQLLKFRMKEVMSETTISWVLQGIFIPDNTL
jgi:hypothetical protein